MSEVARPYRQRYANGLNHALPPTQPSDGGVTEKLLITREAVDNFMGWVHDAQELRIILLDLIEELRDHEHDAPDAGECSICDELDRAEQRMREVHGE